MIFFDKTFPGRVGFEGKTEYWAGSDDYKNFRRHQIGNLYTTESITYKYNSRGFRCDEFTYSDHRLVFLGCSFTEGIGLPLEETFSHIIHSEIQKRIGKNFPYWNLGLAGCGLDSIVRCSYSFYNQLKPQVIISLFPTYRLEFFDEEIWKSILLGHDYDNKKILRRNPYLINEKVIEYNNEKNLVMLDFILKQYNTLLIWDVWDKTAFKNVDFSNLESFKNYANCWSSKKSTVMARDGMHPGKYIHKGFAMEILEKYGDMIYERLINGAP